MEVLVNGESRELKMPCTISDLVSQLDGEPAGRGIAVALDGEVIPRTSWSTTALQDGARVEVVVAVQGG